MQLNEIIDVDIDGLSNTSGDDQPNCALQFDFSNDYFVARVELDVFLHATNVPTDATDVSLDRNTNTVHNVVVPDLNDAVPVLAPI
jgi:hypothetical protein